MKLAAGEVPQPSVYFRTVSTLIRAIPPQVRGKARLGRFLLPLNQRSRPVELRDASGCRLLVPNLLETIAQSLWLDGVYEPDVTEFLDRHLGPESVFVDVGANIGAFAVPLSRRAYRVVAVDASPRVLTYLRENVKLNGLTNVDVVACAASVPEATTVLLYVPPDSSFGMASSAPQFRVEPIQVPARSVDSILQDLGVARVGAVKVDVEGLEAHVFLGAEKLLKSPFAPPIVFEFCDWAEERAFPGRKGWAQEIVMEAGYRLWTLEDYRANRASLNQPVREGFHSIVALPRGA